VKKRLFIAIDISEQARSLVASRIDQLKRRFTNVRVSWTKPENLHLTVKFLGDVEESRITELVKMVAGAASALSPIQAELNGPGVFPSERKPKVLWLGITDPQGSIRMAAAVIEKACEKIGFAPELRPFRPHLTIGRIRAPRAANELARAHIQMSFEKIAFEVPELVLYQSELRPTGSVYTRVAGFELAAN
jgi:2'-5' RNA ligase